MNELSPSYMIDLISNISKVLYDKYKSYKKVEMYITRFRKIVQQRGYNKYPIYNFNIIYKNDFEDNIDLEKTLNNIPSETVIQIAIDLNIEVAEVIYSIARIEGLNKDKYINARKILEEAIKHVYDSPDESIGLANSALESIIKHILEQNILNIKYNKKDTLYKLTEDVLKSFNFYPSNNVPDEIKRVGSSLLNISKAIETLRSEKTKFHGKDSSQIVIEDPLYACFIVNSVATIGNFLIGYFEKFIIKKEDNKNFENENFLSENDLPF